MGKLGIFLMLASLSAFATTYEIPTLPFDECVQKADVIFYGKVKSHELIPPTKGGYERKVTFEVLKSFKGKPLSTRTIYFNRDNKGEPSDAPSGIFGPDGETFIFTSNTEEPTASVGNCSGGGHRDLLKGVGERPDFCELNALNAFVKGESLKKVAEIYSCPWPKSSRKKH